MKTSKEIMELLQAPFLPEEIEWRVGSTNRDKTKGLALGYVTNRAIQNRLDEVFGPFGWKNEFVEWKGQSQLCGISVKWEGEWITKWDGADDSQTEAVKGGLSDSMKRAAYQWGIGRYLYKLPQTWVPLKDGKYLQYEPQLPEWALPKGYKQEKKQEPKPDPKKEQPGTIEQKTLAEIKVQWLKMGYNAEALKKQIHKLYGVELTGMKQEDAQDFLDKLHETARQKESETTLQGVTS